MWTHSAGTCGSSTLNASLDHAACAPARSRSPSHWRSPAAGRSSPGRRSRSISTIARSDAAIATPIEIAIGTAPIEMGYRFVVSPNALRFTGDEVVFVHFLDTDGELMWTDDHFGRQFRRHSGSRAGLIRRASCTMFSSAEASRYLGRRASSSGILLAKKRRPRCHRLARTSGSSTRTKLPGSTCNPQAGQLLYVVFRTAGTGSEVADGVTGAGWRWSKKNATLAFNLMPLFRAPVTSRNEDWRRRSNRISDIRPAPVLRWPTKSLIKIEPTNFTMVGDRGNGRR